MSATREQLDQSWLDFGVKTLGIANVQADMTLKAMQTRFEPWQVIMSGLGAAGVLMGAGVAVGALMAQALLR